MQKLVDKIKNFEAKKILVIGDLILDEYALGDCNRISPEAPLPVLKVREIKYNPGGAGNTAINIKTLGSEPYLTGIVGQDKEAEIFKNELKKRKITCSGVLFSPYTHTIRKQRFFAQDHPVGLRADYSDTIIENDNHYNYILDELKNFDSDIIIISDYAKATLSELLIQNIITYCKRENKSLIVDPRPEHTSAYKNASFVTPNFKEACKMTKLDIDDNDISGETAKILAEDLYEKLNSNIVLTMSEKGIFYYSPSYSEHFRTFERKVRDVSGAGDTVVAALAVGLANNLEIRDLINFANHAAGVAVEKSGVQSVSLDEVIKDIKFHNNPDKDNQNK